MNDFSFHPIADLFPLLQGAEFDDLVKDIQAHGLLESVWLYEDKVLDGRNRLRACREAGINPTFREYAGTDPVGFVVSLNLHRRHLNESQRAMVAGKVANVKNGGDRKSDQWSNSTTDFTNGDAASLLNVGQTAIKEAKKVQSSGTQELIDKVESGEIKVSIAAELAKLPEEEQQKILLLNKKATLEAAKKIRQQKEAERRQQKLKKLSEMSDPCPQLNTEKKYPIILADPPWKYEHTLSNSRSIENHYPVMDLEAIKSLPVLDIATDAAALFMWTTAPKWMESAEVMTAWDLNIEPVRSGTSRLLAWATGSGSRQSFYWLALKETCQRLNRL